MANKFVPWIDLPVPGETTQAQNAFASDSQRTVGFVAGDPASAIRVNSALRQANVVVAALMQLADELKTLPDLDLNSKVADIASALKASIITPIETHLTEIDEEITALEGGSSTLTDRVDTLESEMDAVESKNLQQDTSIGNLTTRMGTAETDIDNLEEEVANLTGGSSTLTNRVSTLEGEMDTAQSDINSLETRMTTAEGEIDTLQSDMTSAKSRLDELEDFDDNIANTYAKQNGNYPNMTVGNATNAECDGDGNVIADTYAKQNGSYPNMTVGNATDAANADNAIHATTADSATKATNDSLGNNIKDSYINKWEMANATVNGSLIWGSGWIDFKRSGNVCICTFEMTAPSTIAAWTNRKIANYPSGYSNGYGTIVGAGQMDSVDNMVPVAIYALSDGIYVNGKAHTIDSNKNIGGFVVWLTGHLKG